MTLKYMVSKQIKDLKTGDLFVSQYSGSNWKAVPKPPKSKIKIILHNRIMELMSGDVLIDHHLNTHKGWVYVVVQDMSGEYKWAEPEDMK